MPSTQYAKYTQARNHPVSTKVSALELECERLRTQLQSALKNFTDTVEQAKSSDLDVTALIGELQDVNKKLEESHNGLLAINRKLETKNSGLQEENELLTYANADWKDIFESANTSILFLEVNFKIRDFTPLIRDLFCIQRQDIGRSIFDLKSHCNYSTLRVDAIKADATSRTIEREVKNFTTGKTFNLYIKRHQTLETRLAGYVLSFVDITEPKALAETALKNERKMAQQVVELEHLYETTPVGLCLVDRDLKWVRMNESLAAMNGYSVQAHLGASIKDLLLPDIHNQVSKIYKRIFASGNPELDLRLQGVTSANPQRILHSIVDFYPIWQDGVVFAVATCVRDVTDETEMQNKIKQQTIQNSLMLAELQHRVKNTITIISSISLILMQGADDVVVYQERLNDRLEALSRTHDLLTDSYWSSAHFSDIISNEASPYTDKIGTSVRMEGPDFILNASQAMGSVMAIHELMTNAAKYGALSNDQGYIMITTSHTVNDADASEGTPNARFVWKEHGGPKIVTPPSHTGFGSIVIKRVLESDLNGIVTLEYHEDGLSIQVDFPLDEDAGHPTT